MSKEKEYRKPKARSVRRKKRKFTGNQYTAARKTDTGMFSRSEEEEIDVEMDGDVRPKSDDEEQQLIEDVVETPRTTKSASYRKLRAAQCQSEESCSSLEEEEEPPINCGFRLIDLTVLAQIFEWLLCPVCKSNVTLVEDLESKMGFATALRICCTKATCKFSKPFFTSTKNGQFLK